MGGSSDSKRYFTVAEANQRLPLVKAIVKDIVSLYREVHDRRERLARIRHRPGLAAKSDDVYSEELDQIEEELEKDIERLEAYVDELHALGVEFKDPVMGLVDFPTQVEGRDALLCWKLGEDEIAWWHELDSGYQGRKSLLEGSLSGRNAGDEDGGSDTED